MRSKFLFWSLAVLVFGSLGAVGFLLAPEGGKVFFIAEGIALVALIFFIVLYLRLVRPYSITLNAIELLKGQDFSSRLAHTGNGEADKLIDTYNQMLTQLREERIQLREKNGFLDLLVNASPQGIVILDFDENITDINSSAMRMLGIGNMDEAAGRKFAQLEGNLAEAVSLLGRGEDRIVRSHGNSIYRIINSSFSERGFDHPFILIEELTRELQKIEKESYENIIRMISHEVNNSMGAISSTLGVVTDTFREGGKTLYPELLPALEASTERCGNLSAFIANLARLVRIPKPAPAPLRLNETVKSVEAITRTDCANRDIRLVVDTDLRNPLVYGDGIQLEQVLVNIVKNSCEAIGRGGEILITTGSSPNRITVRDNGPGIPEEVKDKLFTPFFTTKQSGQGIGLMFVKEMLSNHDCTFSLSSADGHTTFEIVFR